MATTVEYIDFVMDCLPDVGMVFRYKRMFGEYCVYANDKPVFLVCDNTVYVKMLDCVAELMVGARTGIPYTGGKPHYLLDVDNGDLVRAVVLVLERNVPLPKPRKSKSKI